MNEIYIPRLHDEYLDFPKCRNDKGLVAWGGDLGFERLMYAYKNGIFPWFSPDEPILWWSPNPRCILYLDDIKVSKSLKKSLKKFQVTYDKSFSEVIKMCKSIRDEQNEDTWIDERILKAYNALHEKGFAHSVETWFEGELVGGLYGVCVGKMFCGESMFSKKSDASKVALVNLVGKLKKYEFELIDCQVPNPHLLSLGASCISRDEFLKKLKVLSAKKSGFSEFAKM